jgi:asparagine N-glycosylation enzyme membrane subunit Stt3
MAEMAFEVERALLASRFSVLAKRLEAITSRMPGVTSIPAKWLVAGALLSLAGLTVLLRCAHLLRADHYYMLNVDSHYFHWLAGRVMAGEGPPVPAGEADIYTLHSGLAYPLAYIAKAVGSVFNMSAIDALDITCKFVPPVLGVIGMLLVFWAANRMFGRAGGLFSALAWAAILHSIFHGGAAGNIDRDVLSLLLLMAGLLLFYFLRQWRFYLGRWNVGWLITGGLVLVVELLLYLEWNFIGPALLLIVILAYFLVRLAVGLVSHRGEEGRALDRLAKAADAANWRAFATIVAANLVAVLALGSQSLEWLDTALGTMRNSGSSPISELRPLWAHGFSDFISYHFFIIPLVFAFYVAWKRKGEGSIFSATWFVSVLFLAMFSSRILIYAIPAACLLSGLGLAEMWARGRWMWSELEGEKLTCLALWLLNGLLAVLLLVGLVILMGPGSGLLTSVIVVILIVLGLAGFLMYRRGGWERYRPLLGRLAVADLIVLMVFFAVAASLNLQGQPNGKTAAREGWHDAMAFVRENSPEDAVVMAWWDYGYWILDLGQRRPVVDNGYYGWDIPTMLDIKEAYLTSNPAKAAAVMEEYEADYLVMSAIDTDPQVEPLILSFPFDPVQVDGEYETLPEDSLLKQSLSGEFQGGGGLEEWYRNEDVVILELSEAGGSSS